MRDQRVRRPKETTTTYVVVVSFGDPAEIRTPDTLLKRQVLCRLSYWVMKSIKRKTGLPPQLPDQKTQKKVAGMAGLEPASEGVKVPCLTTWLHPYMEIPIGFEPMILGLQPRALPLGYGIIS